MNVYINESKRIIDHPKFNNPMESLDFKRGDVDKLRVYFVENFSIVTPVSGRDLIFACKKSGDYDNTSFLIHAASATIVGDYYLLKPGFNTLEINSLLGVDNLSTNNVASVSLMGEFTWSDISNEWNSSNQIPVNIINDVIRNTEETPLASPTPEQWLATYGVYPLSLSSIVVESTYANTSFPLDNADIITYHFNTVGVGGNEWSVQQIISGIGTNVDSVTVVPETKLVYMYYNDAVTASTIQTYFTDPQYGINVTFTGTGVGIAQDTNSVLLSGGSSATVGIFGQDAIINNTDVYKCINTSPYKWTKLN